MMTNDRAVSRSGGRARSDHAQSYLVPLMSTKERQVFIALSTFWLVSLLVFWRWWLLPEHNIGSMGLILNSTLLLWTTVVPGYFLLVVARARVVNDRIPLPRDLRVAMVVTKAPSEPFALVEKTLLAMLRQPYPHDTWLADEDPSPECSPGARATGSTSQLERVSRVIITLRGRAGQCKEGNLAYFYDRHGYQSYDVVVQLDADHVPSPRIPEGNVAAFLRSGMWAMCRRPASATPTVPAAGRREGASMSKARCMGLCRPATMAASRRLHRLPLRGADPALQAIGGLGPELAEDHSTTLMMNAHGWRGVHALHAIANGEGPRTFTDMITQEFQWSRSLVTILLRYTKTYLADLSFGKRAQFIFAQAWYPIFSFIMLGSYALPILALLKGSPWVDVTYAEFLLRATPVTAAIIATMCWVRSRGWFRPVNASALSWEGIVFLLRAGPGPCSAQLPPFGHGYAARN